MNKLHRLKVSVSGVRGIVGEALQPVMASELASSFGGFIGKGTVIVARDTRPSGKMLEDAVIAGLLASGCSVLLAGILPVPALIAAIRTKHASGAIMISASRTSAEWNAMKFLNQDGIFLSTAEMDALLDVYNQPDDGFVQEPAIRPVFEDQNLFEPYAMTILNKVDTAAIRAANLKVAIDCFSGAGALFTARFLRNLGVSEVFSIHDKPDGTFPPLADTRAGTLAELRDCVLKNKCHIGFAQDIDGDRIAAVDETGRVFTEQESILIPALRALERTPGNVCANIQTTAALEEITAKFGGHVFYTKVGEVNVIRSLLQNQAVFGAEGGTGGVIWPESIPGCDSFAAIALYLEKLALGKCTVSALMKTLPNYYSATINLACQAKIAEESLRGLAAKYERFHPELIDGVRIPLGKAWALARVSNTEPVIRIYAESSVSQADAETLANTIRKDLSGDLL